MKRRSALLLVTALGLSSPAHLLAAKKKKKNKSSQPAPAAPATVTTSVSGLEDSVVILTFTMQQFYCRPTKDAFEYGQESGPASGSGFIVQVDADQYLYTNVHCLAEATQVRFRSMSGTEIVGFTSLEVSDTDTISDVARLKLQQPVATPLQFAPPDRKLQHGERVVAYGDSGGIKSITALPGKILGIGPHAIETDAPFIKGNSGGPLLLAGSPFVIGINTEVLIPGGNQPKEVVKGTRFAAARRVSYRPDCVPQWRAMPFNGLVAERRRIDEFNRGTAAILLATDGCLTPGPLGFKLLDSKQEAARAGTYRKLLSGIGDDSHPIVKRLSEGVTELNSKLSAGIAVAGGVKSSPSLSFSSVFGRENGKSGTSVAGHVAKQYFQSFYQSVLRGAENTGAGLNDKDFSPFHAAELRQARQVREAALDRVKQRIESVKSADWAA